MGMSKNLATRLASFGITVNDVAPAMVESGMLNEDSAADGSTSPLSRRLGIPIGRLGTAEEVANAVEMFCRSGYITGQSLLVAGGLGHQ
jgi:3-oxoacyl-[acyl-carrier protein] reductase